MDIIDFYDFLDRVTSLPWPLLLLGGSLLIGVFLLLVGAIIGKNRRNNSVAIGGIGSGTSLATQVSTPQSSAIPEITEAEVSQVMASLAMLPPASTSVVSVYRIVEEKKNLPFGADDPERFLVALAPPADATITLTLNGQKVKEQRSNGIAEIVFPDEGEVEFAIDVSGVTASEWKTTITVGKGSGGKVAEQAATAQLTLTKTDGTLSSVSYRADYYYLQVTPNYPLKVNIYVDDTFYMTVTGSEYFTCAFNDAGDHTMYASLEDNYKNATNYLYVTVYEGT